MGTGLVLAVVIGEGFRASYEGHGLTNVGVEDVGAGSWRLVLAVLIGEGFRATCNGPGGLKIVVV